MSQEKKGKEEEEGVTFRYSSVFSLYKYIYVCIPPSLEAAERASWPISLVYVEKMRGSLHLHTCYQLSRLSRLTRQAKTNENNTCG